MSSSQWNEINLGNSDIEIIDGDRGKNYPNGSDFSDEGYCLFLNAKNVTMNGFAFDENMFISKVKDELLRKGKLIRNDIVLTTRGTVGNVAYFNEKIQYHNMRINSGMVLLRCLESKILPAFAYWLFRSPIIQNQIKSIRTGSAQPQLPIAVMKNLKFPMPSLIEQKSIADTISSLDNKIELNNRMSKNLEEMAQAIFKSWFVDFEPFQDGEFEDSELGRIPKGWRVGTFGNLLDNIKTSEKAGVHIKDMPYVPIDSIPMRSLGLNEFKSGEEAQSSLIRFSKDDILIGAMRVYFHRVVLAPFDGVTRTTCFVLRPKHEFMISYALLLCNLDSSIEYAQKTSKGSTMPYAVWDGGLKDLKVIIPEIEIMKSFNELLSPLLRQIRDCLFENKALIDIREALLPKLMSGEIRVPLEEVQ